MTRTDTVVVGTLVVLLAVLAGLIGVPASSSPRRPSTATASPSTASPGFEVRPYVEGVLGAPVVRLPADRPDPGRSRPRRAALRRPRAQRAGRHARARPRRALVRGRVGQDVDVRPARGRALARRRAGHGRRRRSSRSETLQDPAYTGPSARSWTEVTVATTGPRQVRFTLKTPLGGFLQALTQPIAPAHLLGDVPIASLADDPFGGQPVGSGPFARDRPHPDVCLARPRGDRPGNRRPEPDSRLVPGFAHDAGADPPPVAAVAVPRRHRAPVLHRCRRPCARFPRRRSRRAHRASRRRCGRARVDGWRRGSSGIRDRP